jgi:hypothetical protein
MAFSNIDLVDIDQIISLRESIEQNKKSNMCIHRTYIYIHINQGTYGSPNPSLSGNRRFPEN